MSGFLIQEKSKKKMRYHFIHLYILMVIPFFIFVNSNNAQEKTTISTVVIDAGHGGKDPGTIGLHTQEKRITLAVALKLGEMIHTGCKDVKVLYTRNKDEFIELFQRAEVANRNKADLFISVHCNANPSHAFHGAETYIMGLHRTHANLDIAKKENASILMEPDYTINYHGFDPNSDESYITFTLFQNAFLDQSLGFAAMVQDEMNDRVGLNDRGVRQAGFLVLYKTTMPSVLIETGFLSNPEEEKFLISEKGQEYIASAIFRAFKKFKEKTEGHPVLAKHEPPLKKDTEPAVKKDSPVTVKQQPAPIVKKETVHKTPAAIKKDKDMVVFRVQFSLSSKEIKLPSAKFPGIPDIRMYRHQGYFKYTSGNEMNLDDALRLLDTIKSKGYKDAFVVGFHGTERITIAEAKALQGK